uniref:Uncharacterized protein n=1 Tax=Anguilla anguilla TaxID=7936 RepID=A0A0E9XA91_ANGAN
MAVRKLAQCVTFAVMSCMSVRVSPENPVIMHMH